MRVCISVPLLMRLPNDRNGGTWRGELAPQVDILLKETDEKNSGPAHPGGPSLREGVTAVMEKRTPKFEGR